MFGDRCVVLRVKRCGFFVSLFLVLYALCTTQLIIQEKIVESDSEVPEQFHPAETEKLQLVIVLDV